MNQRTVTFLVGRFLAAVGSVCLLGPLAAFLFTVYTMARQFGVVAEAGTSPSSDSVRQGVHSVFTATSIGLSIGLLGVLFVCIAIFGFRFTAPWLRSALIVGMVGLLPAMPLGTVFAVALFLALRRHSQASSQLTVA